MTPGEELEPEPGTCLPGSPEGEAVDQECTLRTLFSLLALVLWYSMASAAIDHLGAFDRGLGWGPMG